MFPKNGTLLPGSYGPKGSSNYASAVAEALRAELGGSHQAVKTIMRWSGANERSARNWLMARKGPRGEHLVRLMRHSDAVLEVVLRMAGRERILATTVLVEAREVLARTIAAIDDHINTGKRSG